MQDIRATQDLERNIRRQLAKAHYYGLANGWHLAGSSLAIVFALVSPVVLLQWPSKGPLLGAVAGAWIFMSRLLFEPIKQRYQVKGAAAQELFDCDVFRLEWNTSLLRKPAPEEIRRASVAFSKPKKVKKQQEWYPAKEDIPWPRSVIICQRSNAVWARRQHQSYGVVLIAMAALWALIGVIVALVHQATLGAYLTTIALPSLPALLDATKLGKKHFFASAERRQLEDNTDRLLAINSASRQDLRDLQDQVFELRQHAPPLARWFYKVIANDYEEDMIYAAQQRASEQEET
jgi:hypothetical protein